MIYNNVAHNFIIRIIGIEAFWNSSLFIICKYERVRCSLPWICLIMEDSKGNGNEKMEINISKWWSWYSKRNSFLRINLGQCNIFAEDDYIYVSKQSILYDIHFNKDVAERHTYMRRRYFKVCVLKLVCNYVFMYIVGHLSLYMYHYLWKCAIIKVVKTIFKYCDWNKDEK